MLKKPNKYMHDDNPAKDIYNADNPLRKKAIKILEAIADEYGNPEMFDSVQEMDEPDGTWYEYEDLVTEILNE